MEEDVWSRNGVQVTKCFIDCEIKVKAEPNISMKNKYRSSQYRKVNRNNSPKRFQKSSNAVAKSSKHLTSKQPLNKIPMKTLEKKIN